MSWKYSTIWYSYQFWLTLNDWQEPELHFRWTIKLETSYFIILDIAKLGLDFYSSCLLNARTFKQKDLYIPYEFSIFIIYSNLLVNNSYKFITKKKTLSKWSMLQCGNLLLHFVANFVRHNSIYTHLHINTHKWWTQLYTQLSWFCNRKRSSLNWD